MYFSRTWDLENKECRRVYMVTGHFAPRSFRLKSFRPTSKVVSHKVQVVSPHIHTYTFIMLRSCFKIFQTEFPNFFHAGEDYKKSVSFFIADTTNDGGRIIKELQRQCNNKMIAILPYFTGTNSCR